MLFVVVLAAVVAAFGQAARVPLAAKSERYPVGSTYVEKVKSPAAEPVSTRALDMANNNKNGPNIVILKPVSVQIYYGSSWTQAQRDHIEFFVSNVGSAPIYTTVQTLKNPDGKVIAPLKNGGSFFDNDATYEQKKKSIPGNGNWPFDTLQKYITAKSIGGQPFDIKQYDLSNTMFNIITSGNVKISGGGYCGYHQADSFTYPGAQDKVRVMYSINVASICGPFGGTTTNGQGGNALISTMAPNAATVGDKGVADAVIGTLLHEILETISDPMLVETAEDPKMTGGGGGTQSWFNNDDGHFLETEKPSYIQTGGNNENSDLCSDTSGLDPSKFYNTANPNNAVTKNENGQYVFNANAIVGGKYFLLNQNYVYSPPNSQCAMSADAIVPLPAATQTNALTFYNGINDNNQYYLIVLYYTKVNFWTKVWKSPTVAYGSSVQFSKVFPPGNLFEGYRVVRAKDNVIVASKNRDPSELWTIDNVNSWMVLAWSDAQNNYFTGSFGTSGVYNTANIVAVNAAYPVPTKSGAVQPGITVTDNATPAKTLSGKVQKQTFKTYSANNNKVVGNKKFAFSTYTLSGTSVDISGYTVKCTYKGRETITAQAAAGTTVSAGTTTFVICLDQPKMQTALLLPGATSIVPSVVSAKTGLTPMAGPTDGTAVTSGYSVLTQYGDAQCSAGAQTTVYAAIGQCIQTGLNAAHVITAYNNGGVTSFIGTEYTSTTCDAGTQGAANEALEEDTSVVCQPSSEPGTYLSVGYTTTVPAPPAGQFVKNTYASAAACAAATSPQTVTVDTPSCSVYYGSASQKDLCAANVTVTSTTGGFFIQRYYGSAGCQGLPLVTQFNQLNVCGQDSDSGSFLYKAIESPEGPTLFQRYSYLSNTCTGQLAEALVTGSYYANQVVSQANTSMICQTTGLNDPNMGFVTVVYAPLLGFSSGWGTGRFSSQAACNSLNTTQLFSGIQYTAGCVQDADTASSYISVGGCSSNNNVVTPTTLTYTQVLAGVTVATAQSAAFQTNYILTTAAYLGVPVGSVSITSVTAASSSRRRALLQSGGVNIFVAVLATFGNVPALNNLLRNAGPAIVNALATAFPGISLPPVVVVVAPASSTFWTAGVIAGVVIAGAVAIVLIVLLSILIPRMQHYRQQPQVYGGSFPTQQQFTYPQQQSGVPPGAFYASPQQQMPQAGGMEMGVKTVSF